MLIYALIHTHHIVLSLLHTRNVSALSAQNHGLKSSQVRDPNRGLGGYYILYDWRTEVTNLVRRYSNTIGREVY